MCIWASGWRTAKSPRCGQKHHERTIPSEQLGRCAKDQSSMIDLEAIKSAVGSVCFLWLKTSLLLHLSFRVAFNKGEVCELFADNDVVRVEPEIAFTLAKSLPANQEGWRRANQRCYWFLPHGTWANAVSFCWWQRCWVLQLADGLVNQGLFIGPEIDREKAFTSAEINIEVTQGEQVQAFAGKRGHITTKPYLLAD